MNEKNANCNRKGFYRFVNQNRKVKENVLPEEQGRQTDNMDKGNAEELKKTFLTHSSLTVSIPTTFE